MRHISDQRTALERLEEELQKKEQQISILLKSLNGGLKAESDAEIKNLRAKLAEAEEQVTSL
jgi:uncharacterized FlaG/YvyC family protein